MRIELSIEEFEADPMNYIEGAGGVVIKDGGVRNLLGTSERLGKVCGVLDTHQEAFAAQCLAGWL